MPPSSLTRVVVHHPRSVIVDASKLSFTASIGISLLLNLRRAVIKAGGTITRAALQPLVKVALQHATLLDLIRLTPTVEEALAT